MNRTLASTLALLPSLAACMPVDPDIELQAFSSCDEMSGYMASMARQEVLYRNRWSFEMGFANKGSALEAGVDDSGSVAEDGGGASSYSTTNLQEAGVDESDLMKTDGTWLYSLSGVHLVVSKAWPVEEAAEAATVRIDGNPSGIYLYDDFVVVESSVWNADPRSGVAPTRGGEQQRTVITLVDVSDPTDPQVVREAYTAGELVESRRIDDRLFLVVYQDIQVGDYEDNPADARKAVSDAQPKEWLPWLADNVRSGEDWATDESPACDCTDVYASEREGGSWLVSVLSLDLSDPASTFEGSAVVGEAETIYASTEALYVASSEYVEGPFPSIDDSLQTILHKFDISAEADKPTYVASAKVDGVLPWNQSRFALSEYHGVLRVATTEWEDSSSAVVTTLREEDGQFSQLDSLSGIGEGEEIYATRFARDVGYVVTYFQVDPLFTLDLSDPTDIRVGGHLEMDGWSDYLHPMDDEHLLAVGIDGDWNLQVSLFDVSDITAPALTQRLSLDAYGSESQYDHHAFNYFADQETLAIPAWSYDDDPGLEIIEARITDLAHVGRVSQQETLDAFSSDAQWCAPVRRSVIFEDVAFAISAAGLTAAPLDSPDAVAASVPFTDLDPCESGYDGWYGEEW